MNAEAATCRDQSSFQSERQRRERQPAQLEQRASRCGERTSPVEVKKEHAIWRNEAGDISQGPARVPRVVEDAERKHEIERRDLEVGGGVEQVDETRRPPGGRLR